MASTVTPVDPYAGRTYVPYAGDYASYGYGPEANFFNYGVPSAPPGSTTPPPSSTGGGSGSQSASNQGNNGSGSGTGSGGNAAGAAANAGSAGDFAGHPGVDGSGFGGFGSSASSLDGTPVSPGGVGYPTIPGWLDAITTAAGALLPMPYSLPFTIGRVGLKAYDMLGVTNPNRESMGIDQLSALQTLGGFFGSPYGNLQNPEVANADQTKGTIPAGWGNTGITALGGPTPGWFGFIGGGQPSMSYANEQPNNSTALNGQGERYAGATLPGSSAYDQHQIALAMQQAANGTLPSYSPVPNNSTDLLSAAIRAANPPAAGNAGGASASGLGAVTNPGSSGASTTTGDAGVRGIGAGNLAPAAPAPAPAAAPAAQHTSIPGSAFVDNDYGQGAVVTNRGGVVVKIGTVDGSGNFTAGGGGVPGGNPVSVMGGISSGGGSYTGPGPSAGYSTGAYASGSYAGIASGGLVGRRRLAPGGLASCDCGGSESDQDTGPYEGDNPHTPTAWDEVPMQAEMDQEDLQRTIAGDPGLSGDAGALYRRPAAGTQLGSALPQGSRPAPRAPTSWTPPAPSATPHLAALTRRAAAQPGLSESDRLNLAQLHPQLASSGYAAGGRSRPMTMRRGWRARPPSMGAASQGAAPMPFLPQGAPNAPQPGGLGAVQFDRGGFVRSKSAGRADQINTKVPANTYIMPADVVAALGQGNSLHGAHVLDHIVRRVHARPQLAGGGRLPRNGKADVNVALSGGEYRIPPSAVTAIGRGDVDHGAAHLDNLVLGLRNRFAQHLQSLPPPKK